MKLFELGIFKSKSDALIMEADINKIAQRRASLLSLREIDFYSPLQMTAV